VPSLGFLIAGGVMLAQGDLTTTDMQRVFTLMVGGPLLCWLSLRIVRTLMEFRRRLRMAEQADTLKSGGTSEGV